MEKVMHETARRLFDAAKTVQPGIEKLADLARALNLSEQVINNWSYRKTGVSKQGRLLAQKELGISATWIEDGTGVMLAEGAKHNRRSTVVPIKPEESAQSEPSHSGGGSTLVSSDEEADAMKELPAELRVLLTAYNEGGPAKQEALRRLAELPEQEMATLLLVFQSIGAKYKSDPTTR